MSEAILHDRIVEFAGEVSIPEHLAGLADSMTEGARFEATMTKGIAAMLGFCPENVLYGARATNPKEHTVFEFDALVVENSVAQLVMEVKWAIPKPEPSSPLLPPRKSLQHWAERNLKVTNGWASIALNPLEIYAINARGESCRHKLAEPASVAEARLREVAGPNSSYIPVKPVEKPAQIESFLARLAEAKTNDQKKKALEAFAQFILGSIEGVKVKHTDKRTETSEIDIICELDPRTAPSCLSEFGRYFLVECKNWKDPVGAPEVRDFMWKVRTSKCKLGLLFSRQGITGPNSASDARGEILLAYQQPEWVMVLVISERDWLGIKSSNQFLEWLDKAIDAARFRFKA